MTDSERKQRAIELIMAIDAPDFEKKVGALVTDDVVFQLMTRMPGPEIVNGREAFIAQLAAFHAMIPAGFNFRIGTVICEGSDVALQAESNAVSAAGKKYMNRYHFYLRFDGDRVAQINEYSDTNLVREVFLS